MRPFPTDFPKEFLFISLIVSAAVRLSLALSPGAAIGAVNVYRSVPTLSSSSSPIPSLASETHTTDVCIFEHDVPLATGEGENRAGELVVAFPDVPSACVDERWEVRP